MKPLMLLLLFISSCATCEREDCIEACDKLKWADEYISIHKSVKDRLKDRVCYTIANSNNGVVGRYCVERDE